MGDPFELRHVYCSLLPWLEPYGHESSPEEPLITNPLKKIQLEKS